MNYFDPQFIKLWAKIKINRTKKIIPHEWLKRQHKNKLKKAFNV